MAEHEVVTTEAEIESALLRARALNNELRAVHADYVSSLRLLIVTLSNHRRLALPVEDLQGLEEAADEHLHLVEIVGHGSGICFPALDVDLYVPALIEGVYGSRRWMAELGRKGGSVTSTARRSAARANGAKGGRPRLLASRA
jgi:hypothetical protein